MFLWVFAPLFWVENALVYSLSGRQMLPTAFAYQIKGIRRYLTRFLYSV